MPETRWIMWSLFWVFVIMAAAHFIGSLGGLDYIR